MCSPGLMARLGVPVGGRMRKLRALEDRLGRSFTQPVFYKVARSVAEHRVGYS